jgi:hypothetical protein
MVCRPSQDGRSNRGSPLLRLDDYIRILSSRSSDVVQTSRRSNASQARPIRVRRVRGNRRSGHARFAEYADRIGLQRLGPPLRSDRCRQYSEGFSCSHRCVDQRGRIVLAAQEIARRVALAQRFQQQRHIPAARLLGGPGQIGGSRSKHSGRTVSSARMPQRRGCAGSRFPRRNRSPS